MTRTQQQLPQITQYLLIDNFYSARYCGAGDESDGNCLRIRSEYNCVEPCENVNSPDWGLQTVSWGRPFYLTWSNMNTRDHGIDTMLLKQVAECRCNV